MVSYAVRRRKHLCNLAWNCLCRDVNPAWVVRKYAHVLDKKCLRAVIDKANAANIEVAETLINGAIPYIPRRWLRDISPDRVIHTVARFMLPLNSVISKINEAVSPYILGPLVRTGCVRTAVYPAIMNVMPATQYIYAYIPAVSDVVASQYAYEYLVAGCKIGCMWELRSLIGIVGRGCTRSMMMRALKIWNERKQNLSLDNSAVYEQRNSIGLHPCYDFIRSGVIFSLPPKYAMAAMDFIMTDWVGRGIAVPEPVIRRLLYKSPRLHYKAWDFAVNRMLDAHTRLTHDRHKVDNLVRKILLHGGLYTRLPRSTINRIIYQLPSIVEPKIFGVRDVVAAKLSAVGSSL